MIRLFNHYLSLRVLLLTLIEAMVLFQSMVLGIVAARTGSEACDCHAGGHSGPERVHRAIAAAND